MSSDLFNQNELDRMRLDPDNYKLGIIYYNPEDPRIILPKRNLFMGFTFNFANPISYIILFSGIFIGILISRFV
jgi:uncharacterized membrane protein